MLPAGIAGAMASGRDGPLDGRSALVTLALLLACLRPTSASSTEPERLTLALHHDPALVQADFLSPAVRVEVNGEGGWMLVDTGAAVHTWSRWFADAARLPRTGAPARADLKDSTASSLDPAWVAGITVKSDGASLPLGVAAVVDFPQEFRGARVAGVLSPQLLAGAGRVTVLDLRAMRLWIEAEATAFARQPVLHEGQDAFTCAQESGGLHALSYGVVAQAGTQRVRLLLDTGANHTRIAEPAVPALASAWGELATATGLSGRREAVRIVEADVAFAGRTRRVEARLGPNRESHCGPDGLLGIDALADCVLVLGRSRLAARCDP